MIFLLLLCFCFSSIFPLLRLKLISALAAVVLHPTIHESARVGAQRHPSCTSQTRPVPMHHSSGIRHLPVHEAIAGVSSRHVDRRRSVLGWVAVAWIGKQGHQVDRTARALPSVHWAATRGTTNFHISNRLLLVDDDRHPAMPLQTCRHGACPWRVSVGELSRSCLTRVVGQPAVPARRLAPETLGPVASIVWVRSGPSRRPCTRQSPQLTGRQTGQQRAAGVCVALFGRVASLIPLLPPHLSAACAVGVDGAVRWKALFADPCRLRAPVCRCPGGW